jgi:hypothetical protein
MLQNLGDVLQQSTLADATLAEEKVAVSDKDHALALALEEGAYQSGIQRAFQLPSRL